MLATQSRTLEQMQDALLPYLEKQLGLKPPHFIGRPSFSTRHGTPYVSICDDVCPKPEGERGNPVLVVNGDVTAAIDEATRRFLQGFSRYRDENKKPGDRIVWRSYPKIRVFHGYDDYSFEPTADQFVSVFARFCFEKAA